MSAGGIKPDQPDLAALHQISSPPFDLSLSHSRSSLLRGAFGSQRASNSTSGSSTRTDSSRAREAAIETTPVDHTGF